MMFRSPSRAHSPTWLPMNSGVSSYSPKVFGRPADSRESVFASADNTTLTGIWIADGERAGVLGDFFEEASHLTRTEGAIETETSEANFGANQSNNNEPTKLDQHAKH